MAESSTFTKVESPRRELKSIKKAGVMLLCCHPRVIQPKTKAIPIKPCKSTNSRNSIQFSFSEPFQNPFPWFETTFALDHLDPSCSAPTGRPPPGLAQLQLALPGRHQDLAPVADGSLLGFLFPGGPL